MLILWQIFLSFSQIGLFSLGGGNSMLKLIEDEAVHNRHWIGLDEFSVLVSTSFLFPGLTAVKVAGLVGLKAAGIPGLLLSIIGISLPGLLLAALFYSIVAAYSSNPWVSKLLILMQYGALALLASALYSLATPLAKNPSWMACALTLTLFVAVAILNVSPFIGLVVFLVGGMLLI